MSLPFGRANRRMIVIAYDTPCNRRRRKLAKLLDGYGVRVQKSVFEAHLTPTEMDWMVRRIERLIDVNEDKVYVIGACLRCQGEIVRMGRHESAELPALWIA